MFGTVGAGGEFELGEGGKATQVQLTPDSQAALDLEQQIKFALAGRAQEQVGFLPAGPLDFAGLPGFTSELDFGALPGIPGGIDFSQFSSTPGGIDTSGFTPLPSGIDFSSLSALPGIGDFSADADRVRDATFEQALGLLNPEFARAGDRLEQRLANQGLPIGGEAFGEEFTRFERGKDEARRFAAFNAIQAGGAEQSRLFGLASSARGQQVQEQLQDIATRFGSNSAQFQQALAQAQQAGLLGGQQRADAVTGVNLGFQQRQQGLSEALQAIELSRSGRTQEIGEQVLQRSGVFNELASLLGTSQVQIPQFAPQAPIDVIGAFGLQQQGQNNQFQAQLAAFNAQQQSNQGFASGLFGLGSSAILGGGSLFGGGSTAATLGAAALTGGKSSKAFKTKTGDVDNNAILAALTDMPVDRWIYTGQHAWRDDHEHLGPYAEDLRDAIGVGNGTTINYLDMMGALLSAVQALSAKVEKLEEGK